MPSQRWPQSFLDGFLTPFCGGCFMLRHLRLWTYAWQPVLVSALLTVVVGTLAVWGGLAAVASLAAGADAAWWRQGLALTAQVAAVLLGIAVALASYVVFQGIFCAIFFGVLARQTELLLGTPPTELSDPPLVAQIGDALRAGLKLLFGNVLLLTLNVIPIVGSAVAIPLGLYLDAYVLGSEFLGYSLELRGVQWLHRQRFAKQHLASTLGLGTVVSLFLFVPILGAVLQATAVVGAVLLFHQWRETKNETPSGHG